jgi:hypothetical protein
LKTSRRGLASSNRSSKASCKRENIFFGSVETHNFEDSSIQNEKFTLFHVKTSTTTRIEKETKYFRFFGQSVSSSLN